MDYETAVILFGKDSELVKTLKNIESSLNSIAGVLEDRLSGPIERSRRR